MKRFVVSSYPFIHSQNDTNKMFVYMAIILMIPTIYGFIFFGYNTLALVVVSIVSCYFFELIFNWINSDGLFVKDFSFFVTGLILGLTMPVYCPTYIVIISAFVAIFITKKVFGGLGQNKFNPALVGRCFAGIFSSAMAQEYYRFMIDGETYVSLSEGGQNTIYNLVVGKSIGGVGTTCVIAILLCFIFLLCTDTIDWKITIVSVVSYFIISLFTNNFEQTTINMCSGSFLFVSVFMMTDPNTSPNATISKIIYSVVFGCLSAILWNLKIYGENAVFVAGFIANVFAPIMDKYIHNKPSRIGGFRNEYKI